MKFFLDQDVYAITARFLRSLGHDVVTAGEAGCSRWSDSDLLRKAQEGGRIFVTRDRDFGSLVFVKEQGAGVIYLRILPSSSDSVHKELGRVLDSHPENELKKAFVVVEPERHRIRKL